MGSRADFYTGVGKEAKWLGSVAYDGYPNEEFDDLAKAKTVEQYETEVSKMLAGRDDSTTPDRGWPWPWDDSRTTDYAYAFDGSVIVSCFGHAWMTYEESKDPEKEHCCGPKVAEFPDMSERKSVAYGARSGILIVSA